MRMKTKYQRAARRIQFCCERSSSRRIGAASGHRSIPLAKLYVAAKARRAFHATFSGNRLLDKFTAMQPKRHNTGMKTSKTKPDRRFSYCEGAKRRKLTR